jgi:hypothetical protein
MVVAEAKTRRAKVALLAILAILDFGGLMANLERATLQGRQGRETQRAVLGKGTLWAILAILAKVGRETSRVEALGESMGWVPLLPL